MRVGEMCVLAPVTCARNTSARVAALMRERRVGDNGALAWPTQRTDSRMKGRGIGECRP